MYRQYSNGITKTLGYDVIGWAWGGGESSSEHGPKLGVANLMGHFSEPTHPSANAILNTE